MVVTTETSIKSFLTASGTLAIMGHASISSPEFSGLRRVCRLCRFRQQSKQSKQPKQPDTCAQSRAHFHFDRQVRRYAGPDPCADRHRCVHRFFPVPHGGYRCATVRRSAGIPGLVDGPHRWRGAGDTGRKTQTGRGSRECCVGRVVDMPVLPGSGRVLPGRHLPAQPCHTGRQFSSLRDGLGLVVCTVVTAKK